MCKLFVMYYFTRETDSYMACIDDEDSDAINDDRSAYSRAPAAPPAPPAPAATRNEIIDDEDRGGHYLGSEDRTGYYGRPPASPPANPPASHRVAAINEDRSAYYYYGGYAGRPTAAPPAPAKRNEMNEDRSAGYHGLYAPVFHGEK